MLDKNEIMLICGASGAGKDYLLRQLKSKGLQTSVKVTTRPKRKNEVHGESYIFTTNEEFDNLDLIVTQEFINDKGEIWKYGLLREDFTKSQAFIVTPGEISQLNSKIRKSCFIVYLDIPRSIRESRLQHRKDQNDSVTRRLDADEKDFENFTDYDLRITDPDFDVDSILSLMF